MDPFEQLLHTACTAHMIQIYPNLGFRALLWCHSTRINFVAMMHLKKFAFSFSIYYFIIE